jgi:hypothetical protein
LHTNRRCLVRRVCPHELRYVLWQATGFHRPKTHGLPGTIQHGFLRAAWFDAVAEVTHMDATVVLAPVWAATKTFWGEVCDRECVDNLQVILDQADTALFRPLIAMACP